MVISLNPDRVHEVVHPDDIAEDRSHRPGATVWRIRMLSARQKVELADSAFDADVGVVEGEKGRARTLLGTVRMTRVRCGLLEPARGYDAPWSDEKCSFDPTRKVASWDFLGTIPDEVVGWLDDQIKGLSTLSEKDVGKSEQASSQPTDEGATPAHAETASD